MTAAWIAANLPAPDNNGFIVVATDIARPGDALAYPEATLTAMTTSDPPTYAELCALSVDQSAWGPVWAQWKARGLVS